MDWSFLYNWIWIICLILVIRFLGLGFGLGVIVGIAYIIWAVRYDPGMRGLILMTGEQANKLLDGFGDIGRKKQ